MNKTASLRQHYVDPEPFDPGAMEPVGAENEQFYRASSWKLMWWKFRRHKVAVASALILLAFYLMVPFVEVIAPYNQTKRHGDFLYAPPQALHLFHEGRFVGPFVYPYQFKFNIETFRRDYTVDTTRPQPSAVPLPRRCLRFLGNLARRRPSRLPARGRHALPSRHRPPRARPPLAHHLRRADLADDRHRRHRRLLHARTVLRWSRGLYRRLDRSHHPARHRDPAFAAGTCPSGSLCRRRCRRTGARSSSSSESRSFSDCSTGRALRGRYARSCYRCARRIS